MMAINGSDFSGPNIGKGKAVDGGTTSHFGGKGEWGSSSSGLQIIEVTKSKKSNDIFA